MAFVASQVAKFLLEDARYRAGITRTPSRIEYIRRSAPALKRVAGVAFGAAAGYLASKRSRMTVDQVMSEMATQHYGGTGGVTVGGHSVTQRGYARGKFGRRPTKKAKLALKLIRSTLATAVQRWQRIGKYEDSKLALNPVADESGFTGYDQIPVPLGHFTAFTETRYPVVIFDLTSAFGSIGGSNQLGNVAYVLYRQNSPGAPNYYQPYAWSILNGQAPNGLVTQVTPNWRNERVSGFCGNQIDSLISMNKQCYLEWVDVRMNLYGAKKQATNFHVSLIQFNDRAWDPNKASWNGTAIANGRTEEEQRQYDAAWDEFLKPKVFNPIHSAGNSHNVLFKTLHHRKYTINPDLSNNEDDNPPNINCKFFHNLNRVCRYDWADQNTFDPVAQIGAQKIITDGDLSVPLGPVNKGLDSSTYNQQLGSNVKPYVHPRARVYLMVTAEAFTKATTDASGRFVSTEVPFIDYVPNFDIQIRRKITYDSE